MHTRTVARLVLLAGGLLLAASLAWAQGALEDARNLILRPWLGAGARPGLYVEATDRDGERQGRYTFWRCQELGRSVVTPPAVSDRASLTAKE